ncbi:Oidioi.mRNA.OKI2018_I69.chr2.g4568.t1.cds [Oikopleura dioica]|uniref:Oidioi.mRNA.OKI2018_I69.chr2.g4568.t1.cds n=1 Tax=Oikopleura dioica TaxID=34765 RepID=A0ABN7T220_OIKDI|nr:Oidioi.mRNA.OKI2018_I69.chr2.g4568.t1.cds [Oikopleura dioica]
MREILLFIFGTAGSLSKNTRSCPDQELGDQCDAQCRLIFIECRGNCADSVCESVCLHEYSECNDSCPCFHDCPDGCDGCKHPLCFCKNPELDNPIYKQCIEEAAARQKKCVTTCYANNACFERCNDDFFIDSARCPCMSECPTGCPCDGGYKCQPFITSICQRYSYKHSYIISADGSFKDNRYYSTPDVDGFSLEGVRNGYLNGEIFFFGGNNSPRQITKLNECSIELISITLLNDFEIDGMLVTVPTMPNEILLCSGSAPYTKCEDFNGQITRNNPYVMNFQHDCGCMALDNNMPTAIAGRDTETGDVHSKIEILGLSGWQYGKNHPIAARCMGCVSLGNGILTLGGNKITDGENNFSDEIYLLRNNEWSFAGRLQQGVVTSSLLFFDEFIISFAGSSYSENAIVERLEWNGTHVTSSTTIHEHNHLCFHPIVFKTSPDKCVDSCADSCFSWEVKDHFFY